MRYVLMLGSVLQGICLIALFEPVQVVPAAIRQIDLIKHKGILESLQESEKLCEQSGKTIDGESV